VRLVLKVNDEAISNNYYFTDTTAAIVKIKSDMGGVGRLSRAYDWHDVFMYATGSRTTFSWCRKAIAQGPTFVVGLLALVRWHRTTQQPQLMFRPAQPDRNIQKV